jgi:phage terminase large subunit
MPHLKVPAKFEPLYQRHRYKVFWGGRGGAKSWQFADALLVIGDSRPIKVLCAREIQKSIKESVHSLLERRIKDHGFTNYQVLNNEIRHANGTQFIFEGLWQNIDSIKSIDSVDICWIEEANTVSEDSWKKLVPSIRKEGSEIWVSFNPELKTDAAYRRFVINPPPNAHVEKVSWRDNPWFTQEMRDEMEFLKASDYEDYLHVWEGELKQFADGAVYGKQLKAAYDGGRITSIPIESGIQVNTFWDLGRNDTTAIWFHQRVGAENRFIDYYEHRLVDLEHYVRVLRDKDYLYGDHYLPHDVEVTELTAKQSRREMLEGMGVKPLVVVPRIPDINQGIEQTRQAFGSCWFDKDRCEAGLDALANYQYVFDEKYNTHRQRPLHNWASNGADAFRQFGQGYRGERHGWGMLNKVDLNVRKRHQSPWIEQDTSWRV